MATTVFNCLWTVRLVTTTTQSLLHSAHIATQLATHGPSGLSTGTDKHKRGNRKRTKVPPSFTGITPTMHTSCQKAK
jgi:hypothetical protein